MVAAIQGAGDTIANRLDLLSHSLEQGNTGACLLP